MKRKIALITRALNGGGAERTTSNLSIDLSDVYDVHVIVFDGRDTAYPYGGHLHVLDLPPSATGFGKALRLAQRVAALKRLKHKLRIDCAISLLDGPNLANVLSSSDEKIIVSVRNNVTMSQISALEAKLLSWYCKKSDAVVSLSKAVGIDLVDNFDVDAGKLTTIYNACDGKRLLGLSSGNGNVLPVDGPYIATMGRLVEAKGQWHLIRAFSCIAKDNPNLYLVILGQGELLAPLQSLAASCGIADRVIFPGFVKNPHAVIKNALCFCFPSLYEGLGSVVLEALACGKVVVSADCPSGPHEILAGELGLPVEEIIYSKYGVLTPPFRRNDLDFERVEADVEEQALAAALQSVINSSELRTEYERRAIARSEDFLPETITAEWAKLIEGLCEGNPF